jgi:DNA invertase Pin-like site-specific DNA recombinase
MANGKFVAYYRVSTQKQGASGLGLEAQQEAVSQFLNGGTWELVGSFQEVETGGGSNALKKRPQLAAALALCKKQKATLLIAKLDRLARNVHFISGLLETGVEFKACDMPEANKVMIQMFAVMSEWERDAISARTSAAWYAKAARCEAEGKPAPNNLLPNIEARQKVADDFADKLRPLFDSMEARGLSQRAMVAELNSVGVPAPKGGCWRLSQVQRVSKRHQALQTA